MRRPQNATVAAPESPASVRMDTRSNPATIGAQNGAGLTGTCKECRGPVKLLGDVWIHDGFGYWVHLIRAMRARGV
jgi:hypothetical protein